MSRRAPGAPGTRYAIRTGVESGRVGSGGVVTADAAGLALPGYRPRAPEHCTLHRLVHEHLETFLAEARARSGGDGLPRFVERELREFLTCGRLASGFARFRCDDCRADLLVAFSCKGRGFCPSCSGRRMATLAAHLVDDVLGGLPVRQWVLTTPHRLRYALAYDQQLCRRVLGAFIRAVLSFERRRARRRDVTDGRGGAVTAIQRFGSAANLNVHFHSLVVQGVFGGDGTRFVPLPAPSDRDVWRVLTTARRRIVRIAQAQGIDVEGDGIVEGARRDELAEESPLLAGLAAASVAGRSAIGADAGSRALRLGRAPGAVPDDGSGASCQAHIAGFDLHAGVAVPAGDRERLEHLCRYVLRPPIAQDSLSIAPDGRVRLALRRPWRDGTRALLFESLDFLGRLAALTPKPRVNLLLYLWVPQAPALRARTRETLVTLHGHVAHARFPSEGDGAEIDTGRALLGNARRTRDRQSHLFVHGLQRVRYATGMGRREAGGYLTKLPSRVCNRPVAIGFLVTQDVPDKDDQLSRESRDRNVVSALALDAVVRGGQWGRILR
ncbi:MAG: transposase [Deltaproteobacteria bacterium]|nr:transposase [Deltaproteobacteria bacterium]